MKFTIQIEDKSESFLHQTSSGNAFAVDPKTKLALLGGQYTTSLINLTDPKNVIKSIGLKPPLKWFVSNYEWDLLNSNENERYLQTRDKLIEIVNLKSTDTLNTLSGHARPINQAKWSPFMKNIIASTSSDCHLFLWDCNKSSKPELKITSVGELECLSWSKINENIIAVSCNNDIRIYDIRKANSDVRYLTNAHSKKIYSLDWCNSPGVEILLSSSKDRNIKLWNFGMLNEKFMEKLIEDFPCWKAKFTPYGLCFGVLPTCQSNFNNSNYMSLAQNIQPVDENKEQMSKNETYLLTCQITGFNEAKINKIISNQYDMIVDFDFYVNDDMMNIVTWSRDQQIRIHSLDAQQFILKDNDKSQRLSKEDEDFPLIPLNNKQNLNALQINQTNTTNSSRRSSFSENTLGTSPNNLVNIINNRISVTKERDSSLNLNDDTHNFIKTSTSSISPHEFLKRYPKCFAAKFTGLPEQFILISNEGINLSSSKLKDNENIILKRNRNQTGSKLSKSSKLQSSSSKTQQYFKRIQAKIYLFDISNLLIIRRDLAEKYVLTSNIDLENICQQNIQIAAQHKRFNIVKILELLKFITFNSQLNNSHIVENQEYGNQEFINTFMSLNSDFNRPWSCSIFGRPLINSIIDNCIKSNDIQTAAMVISKIRIHDMNLSSCLSLFIKQKKNKDVDANEFVNPKNSSLNSSLNDESIFDNSNEITEIEQFDENSELFKNISLLDPSRSKEYDSFLITYCDILFKWGLFNKRIEMLEYLNEKPKNMDVKYECFKRCTKCSKQTTGSKCRTCNSYTIKCSLCELPVNGLTLYCISCGHGGHYDHLIDWFKKHDDCATACGCRCVDYL